MKPQLGLRTPCPLAWAAALALSIGSLACSATFAADETAAGYSAPPADMAPGSDEQSARPPVTFFTINDVLATLDRERGQGPNALRLAALSPPTSPLTDLGSAPSAAPAPSNEPFGLFTFRAPDGALWRKWRGVEADIASEKLVLDACRANAERCPDYAAQFLRLVKAIRSKSGRAQLEEANQGVNAAIHYVSDLAQFGELDRWSAPLASFATAKGDCEDYAIAKYVALQEAGFSESEMRLLLVRDRTAHLDHAVLAAHLDGRWLILDNRWSELREDNGTLNFTPLFAISHAGVFLLAAPYARNQPLALEAEPAPAADTAAAGDSTSEWGGFNWTSEGGAGLNTLPLLL
jgi:predicted transglutaminase-like cysteine proteinase